MSLRFLLATLILAAAPVAGGWWAWKGQGPLRQEATVLVKRGTSINQVADQMERDGVIRSASLFKLWARARKLQLIRGEYTFTPRASLSDVAGKLRRAEIHYTAVSIPEGAHAWAVQRRLNSFVPEEVFWTLWKSPRLAKLAGFEEAESLEGLVAPATYKLHHALEPEEVMLMLVEAFRNQVRPKLEGGVLPPYQTLILASLVEKETKLPEEQPRVAGVYKKRLDIGMRLQCDPTSLYARWASGDLRFTAAHAAGHPPSQPFQHLHSEGPSAHAHRHPRRLGSGGGEGAGHREGHLFRGHGQGWSQFRPEPSGSQQERRQLPQGTRPAEEGPAWLSPALICSSCSAACARPEPRRKPASWPVMCW